jgi:helix-turn-helix protein
MHVGSVASIVRYSDVNCMKLQKSNIPFTMVANEVLSNPNISLKAKGLYGYLFSKPDGWQFSSARIIQECKESKPTVLKLLKELEQNCLLQRKRLKTGRVDYMLTHAICPIVEESPSKDSLLGPESKNASVKNLHQEGSLPVSNKDNTSNKDLDTNTTAQGAEGEKVVDGTSPIEKQIGEILYRFKVVNPSYRLSYNRKPQREAARRLLEQFKFDVVCGMVGYLPKSNADRFAPTITTAIELERDLGRLKAWADKQRSTGKGKKIVSAASLAV